MKLAFEIVANMTVVQDTVSARDAALDRRTVAHG